jgi:Holliday junction DNA helicase RuvB
LSIENEMTDERSLRPATFDEFVGQSQLKKNMKTYIEAAMKRQEALDHILLSGLPGLGKTTLAFLIARMMNREIYHSSGPALEKPGDLVGLLTKLEEGDILFIDEIHRLSMVLEEHLYSAMEDYCLDIMLDSGPAARSVRLPLKRFTLIGATTQEGKLSRPFRDRFNILGKLELYAPEDLRQMIDRSCRLLEVSIDEAARDMVASRSRGTPRIVNRILRRLRDFAQVEGQGAIDTSICQMGLKQLGIDEKGLDLMDKKILQTLCRQQGIPVGLKTIAITVGEEEETIADVYEPFLVQQGFVLRTPRGRLATEAAYLHMNMPRGDASEPPSLPLFNSED